MRTLAFVVVLVLVHTSSLRGQTREPVRSDVELVALLRPVLILGAQVEYTRFDHVAPWLSLRYGTHNPVCLDFLGEDCGSDGLSALAGVRLWAGPWGPVEPYVTLGVGRLWSESGRAEATGTAHVGFAWVGFGRVRPRIEFGAEGHVSPWLNVGIGFVP
ncbi:MAG: hypothetical protein ACRELV_01810 [Longimicrobiales bacterium]